MLILKQVQILSILICNRVWFTKELQCVWMCSSFQFLMSKKESLICEFEMDFKKSFCWRSNLSNGDIISVLCKHECYVLSPPPGLKTGVEIDIFWSVIRSEFGEPGGTSPPRSTPLSWGLGELPIMHLAYPFPYFAQVHAHVFCELGRL